MTSLTYLVILALAVQLCACASLEQGERSERQVNKNTRPFPPPIRNERVRATTAEPDEENTTPNNEFPPRQNNSQGFGTTEVKQGVKSGSLQGLNATNFEVDGRIGGGETGEFPDQLGSSERRDEFGRNNNQQGFGQGNRPGGNQGFGQGGNQGNRPGNNQGNRPGGQGFGQGGQEFGGQGNNQGFGQGYQGIGQGNQGFGQGNQGFGQGNQGFGQGGNQGFGQGQEFGGQGNNQGQGEIGGHNPGSPNQGNEFQGVTPKTGVVYAGSQNPGSHGGVYTTPRTYGSGQKTGYQGGSYPLGSKGGKTPLRSSGSPSIQVAVTSCMLVAAAAFLVM